MNWKPIFALLLLGTIVTTYLTGIYIDKNRDVLCVNKKVKNVAVLSILVNLLALFLFKYYNFVNDSIFEFLNILGIRWCVPNLDLLLPIGISFYTFIAIGYVVDVYKGKVHSERDFVAYALFVAFFPQILSGPIARAKDLIPQFKKSHILRHANVAEGVKLMVWGFFMKLCIADVICEYVDATFNNVSQHNGTSLLLGAIFYTIQIYCDFAGYSNIAIGTAKVLDFDLVENFRRPYLSVSMKEFWKRWHISLSSWFMDYVYIPLGGNRCRYIKHLANLMITFLVSGIWHGAAWNFIVWGGYHGILVCLDNVKSKYIGKPTCESKIWYKMMSIPFCFILASIGWIFFRCSNINEAFVIISKIATEPGPLYISKLVFLQGLFGIFILFIKDLKDEYNWRISAMHSKHAVVRYTTIILLVAYIITFGALNGGSFIYFQF